MDQLGRRHKAGIENGEIVGPMHNPVHKKEYD